MDFQSFFFLLCGHYNELQQYFYDGFFQSSMKFGVFVHLRKISLIQSSLLMSLNLINLRNILEVRRILSEDAENIFSIAFACIIQNIFPVLQ